MPELLADWMDCNDVCGIPKLLWILSSVGSVSSVSSSCVSKC